VATPEQSIAPESAPPQPQPCAIARDVLRADSRVHGLDALRFLAALIVMLGHGAAFPLKAYVSKDTFAGTAVIGIYGNLFYGPAAVIVFFVISGFCIHYPYRDLNRRPGIAYFYAGRYIRIGIPMLVVAFAYVNSLLDLGQFHNSVLWSLVAELVYYTLYPFMRIGFRKWGIRSCVVAAYCVALLVTMTAPANHYYANYGVALTWILGLPSWLLGCLIAEQFGRVGAPGIRELWKLRIAMVAAMWISSVLQFHSTVRDPWTMPVFSLLVFFWLRGEVAYYAQPGRAPWRWLESAGAWSYSLYLCHLPLYAFFRHNAPKEWPVLVTWVAMVVFILVLSWLFYLLVERTSHKLAQSVRRRFPKFTAEPERAT